MKSPLETVTYVIEVLVKVVFTSSWMYTTPPRKVPVLVDAVTRVMLTSTKLMAVLDDNDMAGPSISEEAASTTMSEMVVARNETRASSPNRNAPPLSMALPALVMRLKSKM
jgi:hypothetical protein